MGMASIRRVLSLGIVAILLPCVLVNVAGAQGIQQSTYSAPSLLKGSSTGGLDLAPSNPLGLPGSSSPWGPGASALCVSDRMLRGILPLIPNLQFGYLYDFGNNRVSQGRFNADYLLPFSLSADSMIFGEAHTEFQDFWKTTSFSNRVDMSFGGGYRTLVRRNTLLGVNGFYDTSRLGGTWYSSGGVGFEVAALIGSDAVDLNFNWYGQIFNTTVISNAFRYGPSNYDFEAGYSHELWIGGPDLRLKMTGYKFDVGNSVYGWNTGAELKSRDGVFVLRYDVGHDKINQTYQTVGGFVNVGFQLENVLNGESPFTMPEPIFKSPRSLRYMLTQPVKRDWHQPAAVVIAQAAGPSSVTGTVDTTGFCITPNFTNLYSFATPVPLSGVTSFSTLTITFSTPAPSPGGGAILINTETFSLTPFVTVPAGATSITIQNAPPNTTWFGVGLTGTTYAFAQIANSASNSANWCPGLVTFVWQ